MRQSRLAGAVVVLVARTRSNTSLIEVARDTLRTSRLGLDVSGELPVANHSTDERVAWMGSVRYIPDVVGNHQGFGVGAALTIEVRVAEDGGNVCTVCTAVMQST